ncbi:alkene reductase [Burkholderia perseverans]|uniref:oxidoreductase n=1 Tax=Burkholderia perseverans TaxID=2615214 RepID=UPI001FEEE9F6|nr:alkene reductase [Burkholderia perseverans]
MPTELHIAYYRQRASAGLIVTEAIWISREAIGFVNVPGLFSAAQADGWRRVTDAVHAAGGRIFAQLAHSGAVSHPDFFDGAAPLAPSAINPALRAYTPDGFQDTVTPRAMTVAEIGRTVADYGAAARHARAAGFDGVELHCATPYLLPEFLNSALNRRDDAYGGSAERRGRIVIEVLDALIAEWGPGRVGVKIAPAFETGGFRQTDETVATYDRLLQACNRLPLAYVQVVRALEDLSGTSIAALQDTIGYVRQRYDGTLIANGNFDRDAAGRLIERGGADLVSFGKPFIGNPDLVRRFERGLALAAADPQTFHQGGAQGYVDYAEAG